MKYYKVYAQNCNVINPIVEISTEQLNDVIMPLVTKAIENGLVKFTEDDQATDKNINAAYEKALAHLEETEIISCGDYCISKQKTAPDERPTSCGFDTFIFED